MAICKWQFLILGKSRTRHFWLGFQYAKRESGLVKVKASCGEVRVKDFFPGSFFLCGLGDEP